MKQEELDKKLNAMKAPRVTEESIKAKIGRVDYVSMATPSGGVGTLCVISMKNGWISTGFSAPASAENFDPKVGEHYSYQKAFEPLWQLEGYLLKDKLNAA
jgi:hypothetical protein